MPSRARASDAQKTSSKRTPTATRLWLGSSLVLMSASVLLAAASLVTPTWQSLLCASGNVTAGILSHCLWVGSDQHQELPILPYWDQNWICSSIFAHFTELPHWWRTAVVVDSTAAACCLVTTILQILYACAPVLIDYPFFLGVSMATMTAVAFALIGLVTGIRAGDTVFLLSDYGMCDRLKSRIGLSTSLLMAAISLLSIVSFMGIALALQTRKIPFAERRRRAALYNAARVKHGAAAVGVFSIIQNAQQRERAQITTNRMGRVTHISSGNAVPGAREHAPISSIHDTNHAIEADTHFGVPLSPDMVIINTTKL